jgi:hypothetical protein
MAVKTVSLHLTMQGNTQIENLTKSVADALAGTGLLAGIVTVFVKHTTASVMILEDEPGNIIREIPGKTTATAIYEVSYKGRLSRFPSWTGRCYWEPGNRSFLSISIPKRGPGNSFSKSWESDRDEEANRVGWILAHRSLARVSDRGVGEAAGRDL